MAFKGLLQDRFDGIGLEWRKLQLLVEGVRDIEDMGRSWAFFARRVLSYATWDAE